MANQKISEMLQRTPNGQEYFEVIIPPYTPGSNRKVLLSDVLAAGGSVDSVNGETGVVVLDAGDVGADPAGSAATVAGNLAAHIADSTDAHAGSAITNTPAGNIAATTVQGAINELDSEKASTGSVSTVASDLAAHIADTSAAHAASAISFSPVGTIAATDVQAAIAEAASESVSGLALKLNLSGGTMSGAIAMGGSKITGLAAATANGDAVRFEQISGVVSLARQSVSVSGSALALNFLNKEIACFLVSTTSSNFTISYSNDSVKQQLDIVIPITTTVVITFPAATKMQRAETNSGRWVTASHQLTLIGVTASKFRITGAFDGTDMLIDCGDFYE